MAFVSGTSVFVAGFAAGGALLGTNAASSLQANAGWLTIEAGFTLAPLVSHAVAGQSTRGLWFAAPPAAAWGGTLALFEIDPGTIEHGAIDEQRILWSLFGVALLSSVAGVVDAVAGAEHTSDVAIAPLVGPGRVGFSVGAHL